MIVAQRHFPLEYLYMLFVKQDVDVDEIVAGTRKWDDRYLGSMIHAVELYEDRRKVKQVIQEFLSGKNKGAFKLTNPSSKRAWLRELLIAFYSNDTWRKESGAQMPKDNPISYPYIEGRFPLMAGLKLGRVACALVTFIDESWACPDTAIEFDLARAKQKVRNALTGLSFVAAFEAAHYVNEKWKKDGNEGNLVSFHCHAVVWATHYSQLARRRTRIKPKHLRRCRFRPILGSKTGVRFDRLKKADDVCRAVCYQAKMPARGYRTVTQASGKKTQKSANLSYIQRYRLFDALKQYDLLDFWLAGGEGTTIFHAARKKLAEHRRKHRERELRMLQPRFLNHRLHESRAF
jgi:hypothetical protein